jgi:hypothetical protein
MQQRQKSYITCTKIATFRNGMKDTPNGGKMSSKSFTLLAFEKEDGIVFNCRARDVNLDKGSFGDYFKYKFQIRKNKAGETRFIFYKLNELGAMRPVSTSSPLQMRSKIRSVFLNDKRKKGKAAPGPEDYLYIAQQKRLLSVVRGFLRKKGVSFKWLSDDPCFLMLQLCYPGTRDLDKKTMAHLSVGRFFTDDPLKLALRTKGKRSRRLLYEAIKKHPEGAQVILFMAKYLRIHRSLDAAQTYLNFVVEDLRSHTLHDGYGYSLHKLKVKDVKFIDRLNEREIALQVVGNNRLFFDTKTMIDQLNANLVGGFGYQEIRYTTLRELHDQLVQLLQGGRRNSIYIFEHYEFTDKCVHIQFCERLKKNFKSEEYEVVYPSSTNELQWQASQMRNCAFSYADRIKSGKYVIFCLKDKNGLAYMLGYRLKILAGGKVICFFDQAVAHCNGRIDKDLKQQILIAVSDAVSGDGWSFSDLTYPFQAEYECEFAQHFAQ